MKALSLQAVLERLSVSRKTALLLIARGKLQAFKVGRQWRFDPADVDAFIEAQKAAAVSKRERVAMLAPPVRRTSTSSVKWKGSDRYTH
jgi:excisionase family DNA binding protein